MDKKVLLFGYSRKNFGDDFFVYILAKKYPKVQFYINILDHQYKEPFKDIKNINIIEEPIDVRKVDIEIYDAYIYVGGSIFRESEYAKHEAKEFKYFIKECKKQNKPFFYMTCNFGPYQTQEYLESIKENFSLCEGVCVRDKKSYQLFKDIPTVSYAPDMVLAYQINHLKEEKEKKSIGISIIDLETRKDLRHKKDIYEDYIKRIIIKFAKRNYKVNLIAFCEFEEDKNAIERIKNIVPTEYLSQVNELIYQGNIEMFIKEYSKINYMVSTRFHSMILSMLLEQKIYNLCYSKKQMNMIHDFRLFLKKEDINNITFDTKLRKYNFRKVSGFKSAIIIKKAEGQFQAFEEWLNRKK